MLLSCLVRLYSSATVFTMSWTFMLINTQHVWHIQVRFATYPILAHIHTLVSFRHVYDKRYLKDGIICPNLLVYLFESDFCSCVVSEYPSATVPDSSLLVSCFRSSIITEYSTPSLWTRLILRRNSWKLPYIPISNPVPLFGPSYSHVWEQWSEGLVRNTDFLSEIPLQYLGNIIQNNVGICN